MKPPVNRRSLGSYVDLFMCVAIAVAVLALLMPWLLDRNAAIVSPAELGTDLVTKQWPNATYIAQVWHRSGVVPLWRRAGMISSPIIGNPSMLLAYPVYWVVLFLPIGWAISVFFALHLLWAGLGTYGFARRALRLSPGAALMAALAFALSPKLLAHIGGGHMDIAAALAWAPWLLWAVTVIAHQPTWLAVMAAAAALAAQALTHLPTAWLIVLVAVFWGLSERLSDRSPGKAHRWLQTGLATLGALALAIGLSAAQILPMLELLPFSTRGTMTLSEAGQGALPAPLLVGLVFPTALAFPEWVVYVGTVPLALAPASWQGRASARGWGFFATLVVVGTLLALEPAQPMYSLLSQIIPGMRWIRIPARTMFMVQLGWALLAGMGWEALVKQKGTFRLVAWWAALPLLMTIGAAWTYLFPGSVSIPPGSAIIALIVAVVLVVQARSQRCRPQASAILAAMIALEALMLAPQFMTSISTTILGQATPEVQFLASQDGEFRSYSPRVLIPLVQAVPHKIETVDGSDPFQLDYYVQWVNTASGCNLNGYSVSVPACAGNEVDREAYLRAQPDKTLLGIGNVRFVVADHGLKQWSPAIWQSGPTRIYENPAALPRAFVVPSVVVEADDPTALSLLQTHGPTTVATIPFSRESVPPTGDAYHVAQVTYQSPNQITVEAEGPGWLVVSQVWAPGWQAKVDGAPSTVYRTNVTFCGLALPDGSHSISFTYAPTGWVLGRWISLGAVASAAIATGMAIWQQRRRGSPIRD
jgi:hypothetical protein